MVHHQTLFALLVIGTFSFAVVALAEEDPNSGQIVPKEEITCSWSKMDATAYKDCQKRKNAQEKLSEKERRAHNREVVKEGVVAGSNDHFNPRIAGQKDLGHAGGARH